MRNTAPNDCCSFPALRSPGDRGAVRQLAERDASAAREDDIEFVYYDPEEPAAIASGTIESDHALVITDPLAPAAPAARLAPPRDPGAHERSRRRSRSAMSPHILGSAARPRRPYLTLRELQLMTGQMQKSGGEPERATWDNSDPAAYLCRTTFLDSVDDPPRRALPGVRSSSPRRLHPSMELPARSAA